MHGVLAEHLEYLSLQGRHDLYGRALLAVVSAGDVVFDLGCGFGVLGLQALRAGAARVVGIDYSDAIEIARETVRRAGLEESYSCIRASTFKAEPGERADVLVCDHVGAFGVDYGIVAMLEDARKRLLKPGGAVVPRRLRLHLAGAGSPATAALAGAWSREPVPPEYAWLDAYAKNSVHLVDLASDDLCTDVAHLADVPLDADNPSLMRFRTELVACEDATIDSLAGWFEAELAEGVWMTNSPLSAERIDRSQACFPLAEPIAMCRGERLTVDFDIRHEDNIIGWRVDPPGDAPVQRMSTWKSRILSASDLAPPGR